MKKLTTTFPESVMNRITGLVKDELKSKGVYFKLKGTVFLVPQSHIGTLLTAQANANLKLREDGVITNDMIANDMIRLHREGLI